MATTENFHTGGSGVTTFGFTFPILQNSDLKVELDGVIKTENTSGTNNDYSISNTNVVFNSAPASGVDIHLYRVTDVDTVAPVFVSGSAIRAQDLNSIADKTFYSNQEQHQKVKTADVRDGSITTVKIKADNIVGSLIADDVIDSEHIAADSIDSEHYAPNSVDTAAIGSLQVTNNELASNAVIESKILNGAVTANKIGADAVNGSKIADNSIDSEHYVDGSIDTAHLANGAVNADKIAAGSITVDQLGDDSVLTAQIQDGQITSAKLHADAVITSSEHATATTNDTSFLTSAAADARFFNISTGDTIKDGQTFPDNDTTIATTAAINDRIIDLVDDVGGFVPIANETSFPTSNPDVNGGAGTIVSVKAASTNLVPSGTTVTIANGRGSGLAVIITGVSATIPSSLGFLVETTSVDHTYAFHRLVPNATEVSTVAGKATEIGRLGTAAAVEDMSILGTTDVVADLNTLGTADVVSDMNTLATSDVISDMNTLAVSGVISDMDTVATNVTNVNNVGGSIANVNTTAGSIANVNTVAGAIANVNTVGGAITNVNNVGGSIASVNTAASNLSSIATFGDQYQVASSNPSTDGGGNQLANGDLYFNTTAGELKVYNGSAWVAGITQTGNFALTTGNSFSGDNTYADNAKARFGTGQDLEIFHNTSDSIINDSGTGSLKLQTGGNTKLEIQSGGVGITGDIAVSGTVDGVDVAALNTTTASLSSVNGSLVNGVTATTQAASDNSTKVATTAYTTTAIANINTDKIEEGNSKVEIVDAGTGYVTTEVDGTEEIRTIPGQTTVKQLRIGENWVMADSSGTGIKIGTSNSNDYITSTAGNGFSIQGDSVAFRQTGSPNNNYAIFNNNGCDLRVANVVKAQVNSTGFTLNTGLLSGTDSTYDIGTTSNRFANIYGDTIYGDGSNLTNLNIVADTSPQLGGDLQSNGNDIDFADNDKAIFGAGSDLSIYHSGSHSHLQHNGTGNVYLDSIGGSVNLRAGDNAGGVHNSVVCNLNAGVELYHDNGKRFESTTYGVKVTGNSNNPTTDAWDTNSSIITSGSYGGGIALIDGSAGFVQSLDGSGANWYLRNATTTSTPETSIKAIANGGVELYHDDSKKLETTSGGVTVTGAINATGGLVIGAELDLMGTQNNKYIDADIGTNALNFRGCNGTNANHVTMMKLYRAGAVELNHSGTKKFETTSTGVQVTGNIDIDGNIDGADGSKLKLGTGDDLQIYHDGSNSYIQDTDQGNLYIEGSAVLIRKYGTTENIAKFIQDGAVELYHDNSKKIETSSSGVSVTGDMVASGNVTAYSDAKLKTDISTINDALGIVGKLRGVSYKWLADGSDAIGVIAQEVEEVLPEVVVTNNGVNPVTQEIEEIKSVDYGKIVGVLINAINELKAEVDELKGGK